MRSTAARVPSVGDCIPCAAREIACEMSGRDPFATYMIMPISCRMRVVSSGSSAFPAAGGSTAMGVFTLRALTAPWPHTRRHLSTYARCETTMPLADLRICGPTMVAGSLSRLTRSNASLSSSSNSSIVEARAPPLARAVVHGDACGAGAVVGLDEDFFVDVGAWIVMGGTNRGSVGCPSVGHVPP